MNTVLILTVGGSHQPLLTSIEQHQPARLYFLCSADSGKAKGSHLQVIGEGRILKSDKDLEKPDLPNLATLAKLQPNQFEVHTIGGFDDLNACYLEAMRIIQKARTDNPEARILTDYTGGTKSMTAGLAAAALDDGQCEISLVAGRRDDLTKTVDQTQFVRPVRVWDAQAMRRLGSARVLIERYDYAAAEELLRAAAARFASEQTLQILQRGISLCRSFNAWDKFDHPSARSLLKPYQSDFIPHWRILGCLAGENQGHGFEWVEDLLRNAERRALQGRYDDAIGRIYRATELAAQVWLKQRHGIDTGNVNLSAVPEAARTSVERESRRNAGGQEQIKIGLLLAWDVASSFSDDPVGALFSQRRGRVVSFLSKRNNSLFAHGLTPISKADYQEDGIRMINWLEEVIAAGVKALGRPRPVVFQQLPAAFLDPLA